MGSGQLLPTEREYSAEVKDWRPDVGYQFVRAVTLDRFDDVVNDIKGVDVRHLPPFTTLLVRTMNSLYRVVITQQPEVFVQGGVFFPIRRRPTSMEPASGGVPSKSAG